MNFQIQVTQDYCSYSGSTWASLSPLPTPDKVGGLWFPHCAGPSRGSSIAAAARWLQQRDQEHDPEPAAQGAEAAGAEGGTGRVAWMGTASSTGSLRSQNSHSGFHLLQACYTQHPPPASSTENKGRGRKKERRKKRDKQGVFGLKKNKLVLLPKSQTWNKRASRIWLTKHWFCILFIFKKLFLKFSVTTK